MPYSQVQVFCSEGNGVPRGMSQGVTT